MIRIIPTPKRIEERAGFFSLSGISAYTEMQEDRRVIRALSELCRQIGSVSGEIVPLYSAEPSGRYIAVRHGDDGDGYRLTISEEGILIEGDGASGAFYGIQSLRQLILENGGAIPCCTVYDCPDFSYRGFYHDVTRGRVPTLGKLKEIADTLARFKINSLQLYVEDAFTFKELEGIATPECALTPEEILELDVYCRERFIELIPSMATFGHLFTLLQSEKYSHICELSGHRSERHYWLEKQWHHTVDVYDPKTIEVIGSMLRQYIPLFSSKYFNICCDETIDLCNGKNEGKDKGEAYFYHLSKLIDIVRSYGKTVMMWGDECMARPELFRDRVPSDTLILNWCYRKEVNEWIPKFFYEQGFSQIACTGTSCWDNFIENIHVSVGNIESFSAHAKKYGALGILNTNWGDFGHVCPFNCNLYGLLFGAEKSWSVESTTDEDFEMAASLLLYDITEFNMADTLRALARAQRTFNWSAFIIWYSAVMLEGKDTPLHFGGGPHGRNTAADCIESVEICKREAERLRTLGKDTHVISDLILSCRALELMNRLVLYVNRVEGYCHKDSLQAEFDAWLSDYGRAWLRDDKPSGLYRISELIGCITSVKQNSPEPPSP